MNICIESQPLNYPRRSGLVTYTEGLVNSLRRHDPDNDYVMAYYSLKRRADQMPGKEAVNFRKAVLPVPDREFWGRQFFIDNIVLPDFLRKKKCRVFHRPAGYTMPGDKNVFKILTVHDLRTLTMNDQVLKQNIGQYQKALQALDMCAVVSECTKRDLLNHFQMDEKKIKVTYLAADERFRPAEPTRVADVKKKYQLDDPYLLSVGSVPRKNVDSVLRAFAVARCRKNFILVVCCNWDFEQYRTLAKELQVENRVRFLTQVGDAEVVDLYSGCHGFVFPSLYEGFGLPILEAAQCGAPVITSNTSACPEVAGDAAIMVDPKSIEEITAAMDELCFNDSLRKDLVAKGFQRAKLFSWDRFAKEMRSIYEMA